MTAPRTATGRARRAPPPLAPDPVAAGDFIEAWAALATVPRFLLVRIIPDHPDPRTAAKGRTFQWPADRDAALRWIVASNVDANVYFTVNLAKSINKKPAKADIETLTAVHADVDTRHGADLGEERDRLASLAAELAARERPPTFVLDSGGGIQPFYLAAESCPAATVEYQQEVEDYNDRLRCALGGVDPAWNVDRVMRVPGTVNWPDRRKRDRGRVPAMASVLHFTGHVYHWRDIAAEIAALEHEPPQHAVPVTRRPRARFNAVDVDGHAVLDGLPPYPTEHQLQALLENHPEIAAIWDQSTSWPPLDPSPSGWDHRFASELSYLGFRPELIGSFLRAYRAHHEPLKFKQDREDYIMRTVARATYDRVEDDPEPETSGEDDGPPPGAKPNGASDAGQQQTAGDAKGRNRGTFHTGVKPGADWPEPGVLGAPPPAPRFPTEHLPGMLRTWIERQAASMGVPTEVLAVPALVMVGGAIGKDAVLQPKVHDPSWTERPCLWGALIMPKGFLKSPAIKEATAPLNMAEARERERWKPIHDAWKARQPARKKALKEVGNIGSEDPEPIQPKLVVKDATIEALAVAMEHSHGLTKISDELSGFIDNMSRYSKGNDRQFYLECHTGGAYPVDRVLRGRMIVPDLFMGLVGGIQPAVARSVFSTAAKGIDDGLLERFGLIAFPDPAPWAGVRDAAPERDYRRSVADAVLRLADADWRALIPDRLRFDDQAQARFFAWLDGHMRHRVQAPALIDHPAHGFWAKGQGLVCRLTIVSHLFRWTGAEGVFEHNRHLVDLHSLEAGIGIFEQYCVPTYERVIAAFGKVEAHEGAQRVLDLIKRKELDRIRVGDVAKMHWRGLTERKPILASFERLEDIDVLRPVVPPRGARTPTHWTVNPKVHTE